MNDNGISSQKVISELTVKDVLRAILAREGLLVALTVPVVSHCKHRDDHFPHACLAVNTA